jgi:hypothetical protein
MEAGLVRDCVNLVLGTQYVCADTHPHEIYQMICGAGIGNPCAGDISDLALCQNQEQVTIFPKSFCAEFGLRQIRRFRDDYIFVVDSTPFADGRSFVKAYNALGVYDLVYRWVTMSTAWV